MHVFDWNTNTNTNKRIFAAALDSRFENEKDIYSWYEGDPYLDNVSAKIVSYANRVYSLQKS